MSDDNFALICEFCERDFYTLVDLRAHIKEHLPESQSKIKNEKFIDHPDDSVSLSTAADYLLLTESTASAESHETFQIEPNDVNQKKRMCDGNDIKSSKSVQLPINMIDIVAGADGICSSELNNIEPHSIPDNQCSNVCFECRYCGKLFKSKTNRDEHEIHIGKRQYVCHICFKTHDACSNLSGHLWNVHRFRNLCNGQITQQ